MFQNNQAVNKVSSGIFNQDPNAIVAGGSINTFTSLFDSKAGSNAAQVRNPIPTAKYKGDLQGL